MVPLTKGDNVKREDLPGGFPNPLDDPHFHSLVPEAKLNRRGFIKGVVAAGFAVTAAPVLSQAIRTSTDGLEAGDIEITTRYGTIPAYLRGAEGEGQAPGDPGRARDLGLARAHQGRLPPRGEGWLLRDRQ